MHRRDGYRRPAISVRPRAVSTGGCSRWVLRPLRCNCRWALPWWPRSRLGFLGCFPIHEIDQKFRASRSRLNGPRGWIVETEPKKHPAATAAGTDHPTADISFGFRLLLPIAYCLPLFSTNNHGLHSCECRPWNVVRCPLSSWPTLLPKPAAHTIR